MITLNIDPARAFAQALDREDYAAARGLLSPSCTYHIRSKTLRGREAVLSSYKTAGDWGQAHIDSIEYKSRVTRLSAFKYVIRFEDYLRHAGKRHKHVCRQVMTLGPSGKIKDIRHKDLPGERKALKDFFRKAGLGR